MQLLVQSTGTLFVPIQAAVTEQGSTRTVAAITHTRANVHARARARQYSLCSNSELLCQRNKAITLKG